MTTEEYTNYIESLAKTLDEVLTFEMRQRNLMFFKNSLNYKQCLQNFYNRSDNNQSLSRLIKGYYVNDFNLAKFTKQIIGCKVEIDGKQKRYIHDVLKYLKNNSKHLVFIGKKDVKYKSGKLFSHKSFIHIKIESIEELFTDEKYGLASSEHYSNKARNLIYKHLLTKKEVHMTKKEKEQYQKEYDEGKHLLSLKQYEKDLIKQKNNKEKQKITVAKKAVKASMTDYAKMQLELEQAKTEIERLKNVLSINTDIQSDEEVKLRDDNFVLKEENNKLKEENNKLKDIIIQLNMKTVNNSVTIAQPVVQPVKREAANMLDTSDIEYADTCNTKKSQMIKNRYNWLVEQVRSCEMPSSIVNKYFCARYKQKYFQDNHWTPTKSDDYNGLTHKQQKEKELNDYIKDIESVEYQLDLPDVKPEEE